MIGCGSQTLSSSNKHSSSSQKYWGEADSKGRAYLEIAKLLVAAGASRTKAGEAVERESSLDFWKAPAAAVFFAMVLMSDCMMQCRSGYHHFHQ